MPVTFNTNNNYNVDIITEPDVINPTVIKYSSINNTPYIELKITADIYQYPLLAGNMNFDGLTRFVEHNATNNVNNTCVPPLTPHEVKSTSPYDFTPIAGQLANGTMCLLPQITNSTRMSYQGPYQTNRPSAGIYNDQIADGVAWTKVIWVEVYQDDNGQMVNTAFSPELNEDLASWALWDPTNPNRPITLNKYPQYIRAFVFLEFASGGPSGLTSNVDIFIDIDEEEPVYGCTDDGNDPTFPGRPTGYSGTADNYDSSATIDDGSCTYTVTPPPPPSPLALAPPTLTLTSNTALSVVMDFSFTAATGGSGLFQYTATYETDDTPSPVDILNANGTQYLTAGTTYSVNILPLPTDEVDIEVVLTANDIFPGNPSITSNTIITGGVAPGGGTSNPITMGNLTLARGPILTEIQPPNLAVHSMTTGTYGTTPPSLFGPFVPPQTTNGITQVTVTLDAPATGGDGGPFTYYVNLLDSASTMLIHLYPNPINPAIPLVPSQFQQDPYPLDGVYNNGDDINVWQYMYGSEYQGDGGNFQYTEAEMLAGVTFDIASFDGYQVPFDLVITADVSDNSGNTANNFSNMVQVPTYNINPI